MGLRNGRAPSLVLLAEVIFSLRLRSAGAEKAALSCQAGQRALDLGMGVGGPLRAIALFTGAKVTGVTLNAYQVRR